MEIKNLTLVFSHFEQEHLGKDVFQVPYYLGKGLICNTSIVYQSTDTNISFGEIYRGVRLIPLKNIFLIKGLQEISFFISALLYVIFHGKSIGVLMTFHFRITSMILCFFYKMVNPKGKFYLKVDGGKDILEVKQKASFLKKKLYSILLRQSDYISLETTFVYNLWKENLQISKKIFFVENGFDDERLNGLSIVPTPFSQKQNIFITVGRLGTLQKNTKMFLQAIENLSDIKDWIFYFIGPIENKENNFRLEIEQFYKKNPNLENKVIFTGAIYDKKKLWKYYNKAKVFVLTSRWEGYATVFSEAYRFNNYIISTDVGGAKETIDKNGGFGIIIEQENYIVLKEYLEKIMGDDMYFNSYSDGKNRMDNSWKYCLQSLINAIKSDLR